MNNKIFRIFKIGIITTLIMTLVMFASAQCAGNKNSDTDTSEIQFYNGSWNKALALAKQENKPVFLDISASWCGYCKKMKANVFVDPEIAKFYDLTFINIAVDGEKGEGIELAKKYGVRGYPTFVFLNPDGSLSNQTSGYHNPKQFLELGKKVIANKL
ncbi:MAG: thioredoxin family protein [Candidatus Marinimicrobia bacterium]|nr:thioredoxin family protein [Candidatus Neomarinimicrobiota bacterium]